MKVVRWLLVLITIGLLLAGTLVYIVFVHLSAAPNYFQPIKYEVVPGQSLATIAADLESQEVIQSGLALRAQFYVWHDARDIKAGTYWFKEPQSANQVAKSLVTGQFHADLVNITFIEGERADTYGRKAAQALEDFDLTVWDELTAEYEGYLAPNTYKVPPTYTAQELFDLLRSKQDETLNEITAQGKNTDLTTDEIVTIASILEREANDEQSMRTVAGILQNRLDIGMPLQADATIEYALDTPLNELPPGQLAAELRELDSPYNTYLYTGLPPTAISNPGYTALQAVVDPIPSDYLFYITGTDGEFYYATTYQGHLANIERHLR